MGKKKRKPPSPYFGDYPHGTYWSAIRSDADRRVVTDEERYSYTGTVLRIMWDEGAGPLVGRWRTTR